jgi:hypothetical protein
VPPLPLPTVTENSSNIYAAVNIATDFFFAVLPIPVIWGLNVNLRTKLSLIFILGLGFLSVAYLSQSPNPILTVHSACAAAIVKEVLLSTFFTTPDYILYVPSPSLIKPPLFSSPPRSLD